MSNAQMSFGQAPEPERAGGAPVPGTFRFDDDGVLVHADSGEPVSFEEEQAKALKAAADRELKALQHERAVKIALGVIAEDEGFAELSMDNQLLRLSKREAVDLIVKGVERAFEEAES